MTPFENVEIDVRLNTLAITGEYKKTGEKIVVQLTKPVPKIINKNIYGDYRMSHHPLNQELISCLNESDTFTIHHFLSFFPITFDH